MNTNFYGDRKPGSRTWEIYGKFSRSGRWILANTWKVEPFDFSIAAVKKLNGFKHTKVVMSEN